MWDRWRDGSAKVGGTEGQTDGCVEDGWADGWMFSWLAEWVDGLKVGWLGRRTSDGGLDGRLDGWKDGRLVGWTDVVMERGPCG